MVCTCGLPNGCQDHPETKEQSGDHLPVYNFPPTIFCQQNTAGQQIDHVMSEVEEIHQAVLDPAATFEEITEEEVDLIHSLETWLRITEQEHGLEWLQARFASVKAKNAKRGYYDGMEEWTV